MISAGSVTAAPAAADLKKRRKEEAGGGGAEPNPESVSSLGMAGETGQTAQLMQVTTSKSVEFSQERVVRVRLSLPLWFFLICNGFIRNHLKKAL